ncbi:MAG: glycosyltransferase [Candidatus Aenigmarchaeota archaeon]|nr:glycosyltransferase [Candidatus Aenigmarchaeota archaeon]
MKDLSLVLPCYHEEQIFKASLDRIIRLLRATRLDVEVILVEDASKDNTPQLVREAARTYPEVRAIFHEQNQGRGRTVGDGIRAAKGRVVGYLDIDLEIREEHILSHYLAVREGADVAYADRITGLTIGNLPRHLLHVWYIGMLRLVLGCDLGDTNAGCKFFNRKAILPVLAQVQDGHWFWDTEILVRAQKAGLRLRKLPVVYLKNQQKKSTVRMFADTAYFLRKIFHVRGRL